MEYNSLTIKELQQKKEKAAILLNKYKSFAEKKKNEIARIANLIIAEESKQIRISS